MLLALETLALTLLDFGGKFAAFLRESRDHFERLETKWEASSLRLDDEQQPVDHRLILTDVVPSVPCDRRHGS